MYRAGVSRIWRLTLLGTAVLAGCGGPVPTYEAGGTVTYPDGTPINAGQVEFRPVDSEHQVVARAPVREDGTFELGTFEAGDGAIEGEHAALVRPFLSGGGGTPPPGMPVFKPDPIAKRFADFSTSGLRFTVTRDPTKNRFEIQVEPPAVIPDGKTSE